MEFGDKAQEQSLDDNDNDNDSNYIIKQPAAMTKVTCAELDKSVQIKRPEPTWLRGEDGEWRVERREERC